MTHLFDGSSCRLESHDTFPDGVKRYSVSYGDSGWERDPGTYCEPRGTAIEEVEGAIAELTQILGLLKEE